MFNMIILFLFHFGSSALKNFAFFSTFITTVFVVTGCASNNENLQRSTARSIGKDLSPDVINILNVDRGASSVKWTADAQGATYSCSADDMVRQVYCVKK